MSTDEPAGMGQLRILWPAFLVSHGILFGVFMFGLAGQADVAPTVPIALAVVAFAEWAFGLFLAPRFFAQLHAQSAWLVRWAFFESVTIMAGVASFTGGPVIVSVVLFVLALVGMVLTRPTLEAVTAWEVRRLSDE